MRFLDLTLNTLAENLAFDEALLLRAEELNARSPEVLRLWEWPSSAVVLGAAGRLSEEVVEENCLADNVSITRRSSGGGAVVLGPGCLLYTLVFPYETQPAFAEVRASYCYILGKLCEALAPIAAVECAGTSDLAISGFKISGNSQQRKRTHFLHHGTILYAFDIDKMTRYLRSPLRQPDYRQRRRHADFVCNLPASREDLCNRLRQVWQANDEPPVIPLDRVCQLAAEKYNSEAWIRRR